MEMPGNAKHILTPHLHDYIQHGMVTTTSSVSLRSYLLLFLRLVAIKFTISIKFKISISKIVLHYE